MFPKIYVTYLRLLNKKITTDSLRCLSSGGNPHYHNHRQHYVFHEENISLLTVEEANAEGKMSHTAHAGLRDIRLKVKAVPARQNMRTGLLSR